MLIGLAGKSRSGKDTAASIICRTYPIKQYAFSDPLKRAAVHMFGISRAMAYGYNRYDREQTVPEWGISVREMLQKLGTECAREVFGEAFWIIRAESELSFNKKYKGGAVISDVRFDNEASWLKSKGGFILNIIREDLKVTSDHRSEKGLSDIYVDAEICNRGSLEDLDNNLKKALSLLIK